MGPTAPAAVVMAAALLLAGCAGTNWERAVYEGLRSSQQRDAGRAGPEAVQTPPLPPHDRYEAERQRAQQR